VLGGAVATLVGMADDRYDLRARWQLGGQIAVALIPVGLGIAVGVIANPFGPGVIRLEGVWGALFVVVWIVGMINSINFIDGLDGLSSGVGLIAAVTLAIISVTGPAKEPVVALLCLTLAGALLGFLRWNFHPASIFIGTSGVMFLGYTLALLSILGSAKVVVALLVLGVPIIDTFYIIVRRVSRGRSPFAADRGHIHHRLLDLGLTQTQTVLLIYAICAGLGVLSLVLSGTGQLYAFVGAFVVFGVVILVLDRAVEDRASDAD
jgi:UDP-GlcNAc:undecaprenyl-phosphate GlcNAc-1-phosphate transferase